MRLAVQQNWYCWNIDVFRSYRPCRFLTIQSHGMGMPNVYRQGNSLGRVHGRGRIGPASNMQGIKPATHSILKTCSAFPPPPKPILFTDFSELSRQFVLRFDIGPVLLNAQNHICYVSLRRNCCVQRTKEACTVWSIDNIRHWHNQRLIMYYTLPWCA